MVNSKSILNIIKSNSKVGFIPFRIIFTYNPPISRTIFNYNYTLKNIDDRKIITVMESKCICTDPYFKNFVDPHSGHIVTGNTKVITNHSIRKLLNKGCKFRPTPQINKEAVRHWIQSNVESYTTVIKNKYKLKNNASNLIRSILERNTKHIIKPLFYKSIYQTNDSVDNKTFREIRSLQNTWVFCPLDKASNNYGIVCKKF